MEQKKWVLLLTPPCLLQGFSEVAWSHHHHPEKLANRTPRSRQFLKQKARFSQMTVNSLWSFAFTSLSLLPHPPSLFFFHLSKKWLMTLPWSEVIYGQMTLISYWRIEFLTCITEWNEQNIKTRALFLQSFRQIISIVFFFNFFFFIDVVKDFY